MKVSQACEGQDEDEDCGSTACIDAKFNNIESLIYQRYLYYHNTLPPNFLEFVEYILNLNSMILT